MPSSKDIKNEEFFVVVVVVVVAVRLLVFGWLVGWLLVFVCWGSF